MRVRGHMVLPVTKCIEPLIEAPQIRKALVMAKQLIRLPPEYGCGEPLSPPVGTEHIYIILRLTIVNILDSKIGRF